MMTYRYWCEEHERRCGAVKNERVERNRSSEEHRKEKDRMYDKGVIAVLSRNEWRAIVQWRVMKKKRSVRRVWRKRVGLSDGQMTNDGRGMRNGSEKDDDGSDCDVDDGSGDENNTDDKDVDDDDNDKIGGTDDDKDGDDDKRDDDGDDNDNNVDDDSDDDDDGDNGEEDDDDCDDSEDDDGGNDDDGVNDCDDDIDDDDDDNDIRDDDDDVTYRW